MPTVSVILTCFNQGSYVAQAVDSVLAQTFSDFELLVVDNGSTDDSARVLEGYRGDPRIQLFLFPENESLSRRFNNAIDIAAGRYVTFLYADDWYLPTKLREASGEAGHAPAQLWGCLRSQPRASTKPQGQNGCIPAWDGAATSLRI